MYKKFFGLRENPFNVNPDPRYLFLTRYTQEALACLTYGIETRKGFIVLTGEVGTGKTTLVNKLLEWLRQERVSTAFVFNPRLSVTQFFDFMMADFGIPCDATMKSQVLLRLNHWLLERYRARVAQRRYASGEILARASASSSLSAHDSKSATMMCGALRP